MKLSTGEKQIFWDYDLRHADLKKPAVLRWYLKRKLDFGDLSGIKKNDLKKHLSKLDVDSSLKKLLRNYLKSHG